ncbi:hypothetical protein K402DRAFT_371200 [Aulographum hederae CBS 113979]|uniref:Uncharacterized protein n=1 Tax=Aulographum hederae CBS 113979 TaxID=1176131 RepID=A0A6G1HAX6_9PEZI|nr:hypothetical protein K402DRAFT_371200 [Aulographum hederae CBS 113979]
MLTFNNRDRTLSRQRGAQLLPGQPRVCLNDGKLRTYLRKAHLTFDLDKIASHLWLVSHVVTPHHAHISALHHQAVRGRVPVVAESPHLHLVWYHDRIFIKPIPTYLLSHAFWEYIGETDKELWKTLAGFMRTYAYLIQFEVDFCKAQSQELGLIPARDDGQDPITFERFTTFIAPFSKIHDSEVSPRFHFGELRLTRLNMLARVFLRKATYHHINAQWSTYLGTFMTPFLTVFVILNTVLTAMQVDLGVLNLPQVSNSWGVFAVACRWFSVLTILLVAAALIFIFIVIVFMLIHDQVFSYKVRQAKKKDTIAAAQLKSGVV